MLAPTLSLAALAGPQLVLDLPAFWQSICAVVLLLGGSAAVYYALRGAQMKSLREEAAGWERLATLRTEEMTTLQRRLTDMEGRFGNLCTENDALRKLNLELQRMNLELQEENHSLKGERLAHLQQIGDLETSLKHHQTREGYTL